MGTANGLRAEQAGWVQKVTDLILNINIQIEDTASGAVLLNDSVDLRGNTDESWRRGISYIVRDMGEKHQGQSVRLCCRSAASTACSEVGLTGTPLSNTRDVDGFHATPE
jgi:hypothetical protein